MTDHEWNEIIAPAARNAAYTTGMSYELMLVQAAQETGWGKQATFAEN
jgi:flagellum-specific peptidoglycan hydrolase FlgJ